ncbi:hypothetical protein EV363DRAFT_1463276 [Boletus edulis]|nr:hypothetical protein EV363DRAFT_1463276 [Boletus edulis]
MLCRHHHHHRASTVDIDDDTVSPIPPLRPHADNDNGTTAPPVPLDAALGLQALGHTVDIYISHHDPNHCFDETRRDGNRPHRRPLDLHFTLFQQAPSPYTTSSRPSRAIVSPSLTCTQTRRLLCRPTLDLYTPPPCAHWKTPSFLLSFPGQATRTWRVRRRRIAKAKQALYRYPMEYLEEVTTRQADTLVANSKFTARITMAHLLSITSTPKVVYPGINIEAYQAPIDWAAPDVDQINSEQLTLISLNCFEMKKNAALAIEAFALLRDKASTQHLTRNMRLILAGGYDPRLEDNIRTLNGLVERARSSKLSFNNEDEDGMLPRSHANDDDDAVSPPPPLLPRLHVDDDATTTAHPLRRRRQRQ